MSFDPSKPSTIASAVLEARDRLRSTVRVTECVRSDALSDATGADVFLKLETRQRSGSFKLRGVANKILGLPNRDRARGLVAASTGNHGAAFAHVVSSLDLDGRLFLPTTVPASKLAAIEAYGVPYDQVGADSLETELHAARWAREHDRVWVSPYNDPWVVAGQGTIAIELLDQVPEVEIAFVPVGGGGLMAGIASYLATAKPDVEMVSCEPSASAALNASIEAGEIVSVVPRPTLSDATAGGMEPGSITFDICRRHVDRYLELGEEEIADAIRFVHRHEAMVIEGGAALPVAAALRRPPELVGRQVVLVVTGSRIDEERLHRVLTPRG